MKQTLSATAVIVLLAAAVWVVASAAHERGARGEEGAAQVCPFQSQAAQGDADGCPQCDTAPGAAAAALSPGDPVQASGPYICPMHPQVVSQQPGQQCPICGMDLVAANPSPPAATPTGDGHK